jgi:hypothetical protein
LKWPSGLSSERATADQAARVGALWFAYRDSIRLGRLKAGLQAIAIVAWLTLAITITLRGGLRSPPLPGSSSSRRC